LREFEVTDKLMDDFKELAKTKGVEWDDESYKTDEKYLKLSIKSNIARSIWGNNESIATFLPMIKQVTKAMELFPEATEIANLQDK
jgi:hypothetical protein